MCLWEDKGNEAEAISLNSSLLREGTLTNPYELMGLFFCFHTPQKQERITLSPRVA